MREAEQQSEDPRRGAADERFEAPFRQLVARARELPSVLMVEAATGLPSEVDPDDEPAATALRIQHRANVELEAAVVVLGDAVTSPAAAALVRSLLEACSHLHFIAGATGPEERACRAMRCEFGRAIEAVELAHQFPAPEPDHAAARLAEAEQRRDAIAARLLRAGCEGGPRSDEDIGLTLQAMADADARLAWVLDVYRNAVLGTHEPIPAALARDLQNRRNAVMPTTPSERLDRFDQVVAAYGLAAQRFFEIVKPGHQPLAFLGLLEDLRNELPTDPSDMLERTP